MLYDAALTLTFLELLNHASWEGTRGIIVPGAVVQRL